MATTTKDSYGGDANGIPVFMDRCFICNRRCFMPPKPNPDERKRANEMRELFYIMYDVPVAPGFISSYQDELPLCPGCIYKLGRLKVLREQFINIRKEYLKLKEGIAFDIVDVVAGSEVDQPTLDFKGMSSDFLQQYLKAAEVDTLQQFIFDDWHEKYSTDPENITVGESLSSILSRKSITTPKTPAISPAQNSQKVFKKPSAALGSPLTQLKNKQQHVTNLKSITSNGNQKQGYRPQPPKLTPISASVTRLPNNRKIGLGKSLLPSKSNATVTTDKALKGKTTVISITTDEDEKSNSKSSPTIMSSSNKRSAPASPAKRDEKRKKSIEIVVGEEDEIAINSQKNGSSKTKNGKMVKNETSGKSEDNNETLAEHTDYKSDFMYDDNNEEMGNDTSLLSIVEEDETNDQEIELEDYGEIADYLATGNDTDDSEEMDPEQKQYVENLMAELQSGGGGSNLEFQQNEEGLYVCMFCNKTFIHKYPYRDHLKTHTGTGPRCPICNKIFPKNHNLMLHLRTHTGEKPFKCDQCGKGFADKSNLKVHYRVHTGEKPYQCEYCDLAFVNSSRLVVHRRLHTGEKPFPCDYMNCTKSFATSNQLMTHKKVHGSYEPAEEVSLADYLSGVI